MKALDRMLALAPRTEGEYVSYVSQDVIRARLTVILRLIRIFVEKVNDGYMSLKRMVGARQDNYPALGTAMVHNHAIHDGRPLINTVSLRRSLMDTATTVNDADKHPPSSSIHPNAHTCC